MSAAAVLEWAAAEGVRLEARQGRITWRADHPPPADLLARLKEHKPGLLRLLATDTPTLETPPPKPRRYLTAATASHEWRQARDQYINHLMACTACRAPVGWYCTTGASLRQQYNATPMVPEG